MPSDPEEETLGVLSDPEKETLEAPSDPEEETLEAPLNPGQETREIPPDRKENTREKPLDPEDNTPGGAVGSQGDTQGTAEPEKEIREAPLDPRVETNDVTGLAAGSTDLERLVVPTSRKLTISGNLPSIISSPTWSRRVHADVEGAAPQSFLPTNEEGDEESTLISDGGGSMILQRKVRIPEPIARGRAANR